MDDMEGGPAIERVERDQEHVTLRAGELWAIVRLDRDHGDELAGWVIEYSDGDSSQCPNSLDEGIAEAIGWLGAPRRAQP